MITRNRWMFGEPCVPAEADFAQFSYERFPSSCAPIQACTNFRPVALCGALRRTAQGLRRVRNRMFSSARRIVTGTWLLWRSWTWISSDSLKDVRDKAIFCVLFYFWHGDVCSDRSDGHRLLRTRRHAKECRLGKKRQG
jgi:hypothetical protein